MFPCSQSGPAIEVLCTSRKSTKKPLSCPHCSSSVFLLEGYHEFKKIYDATRKDPVVAISAGLRDYVSYAMCAGCKKAATDYLMEKGLIDQLYELHEVRKP